MSPNMNMYDQENEIKIYNSNIVYAEILLVSIFY